MRVLKRILQLMKPKPPPEPSPVPVVVQQGMIHNRIAQLAKDNPALNEYVLNTEEEASELIYAMCATIGLMASESTGKESRRYLGEIRRLKGIINRKQALQYIGDNKLTICGLTLVGLEEHPA